MKSVKKSRQKTPAPVIDLAAGSRDSSSDPHLPHERDEAARQVPAKPRSLIRRGYRDLASGQVDTDCRNSAADIIGKKSKTRLGARRKP
jgi:hypothetical protein